MQFRPTTDNEELTIGSMGTVCHIDDCTNDEHEESGFNEIIGVDWDVAMSTYNSCSCRGHCDRYHGWYVFPDEITLVTDYDVDEHDLASDDDLFAFIMN